jgi:hypothetical protein
MPRRGRTRFLALPLSILVGALVLALGCGGGGTGPNPPPGTEPASIALQSGGGQTQRINTPLSTAPAVIVKDAAGQPVASVAVHFAVTSGGGSLSAPDASTDAQGIARVGSWTLGPQVGSQKLTATTQSTSLQVEISAIARLPRWTVAVYMAADNSLAVDGVTDLDEMEAAGLNPDVQVVVQAEFSPDWLTNAGIAGPSEFNRPNYNTFRYVITGQGAATQGPNGITTDLGNRVMTDPQDLRGFVEWAKQNLPAEHLMVVLWNHGGGYTGLLADESSAPGATMSLQQLQTALMGLNVDVLDFDMCLMGAYETLAAIQGLAQYAVFSEETVPGQGNPYDKMLGGLYSNPDTPPEQAAITIVDQFASYYGTGRSSTTQSAYRLSGFGTFESALNNVATTMRVNLPAWSPMIADAAFVTQRYHFPILTDLDDLADSLAVRSSDATLLQQLAALKQAHADFRLRNYAHNALGAAAGLEGRNDVERSRGLSILLPTPTQPLPVDGPFSLVSYQAALPGKAWPQFLVTLLSGSGGLTVTDQGANRFEGFMVWSTELINGQGDIDLWVLEPSGDLYIPFVGSVTPNGTLTNDSFLDHVAYEGMVTNRYVANGTYKFYAFLWNDPQNIQPLVDFASRSNQSSNYTLLYGTGAQPRLNLTTSWLNDPSATFASVDAGTYSDLRFIAFVQFGPAGIVSSRQGRLGQMTDAVAQSSRPPASTPVSPAQLASARALVLTRRTGRQAQASAVRRRELPQPHRLRAPVNLPGITP